ncbi:MAG TPA: cytochrome c [Gemmatimonadaceae bacterium]|nr:cytochrome c [Gemmatimonadaceae bacterium]
MLCSCSTSNVNGDGGIKGFTDFKRQPKFMPWQTDNGTDTLPPRGNPQASVPIYGATAPEIIYARTGMAGLTALNAMALIHNPVLADSASVSRGRVLFQINCAPCHGALGLGNGPAVKYGVAAPSIGAHSKAADSLPDGYIFGMIRNGRGLMPTYNRIEEPDRWDIVNYLRSIQGKLPTIPADTSHGLPGETGPFVPGASRTAPTVPVPYSHPGASAPPMRPGSRADSAKGGR